MAHSHFNHQTVWEDKFSFLKRCGMEAVYLFILAVATSVRDLEKIHSWLEPNQRLLREDLTALTDYWSKLFELKAPTGGPRLREDVIKSMLKRLCEKNGLRIRQTHDLTKYYMAKLDADRKKETQFQMMSGCRPIYCIDEQLGHGLDHFIAEFEDGTMIKLGCRISEDKANFGIRFVLWQYDLTEESTHRLLSIDALRQSLIGNRMERLTTDVSGTEIDFWFVVPMDRLYDLFEVRPLQGHSVHSDSEYVIKPDSYGALLDVLKSLGLPINGVQLKVPSPPRD
ncbi:hypothetical protein ACFL0L_01725 [Patescibacteria group bacterium]